jgi:hypothetical protein
MKTVYDTDSLTFTDDDTEAGVGAFDIPLVTGAEYMIGIGGELGGASLVPIFLDSQDNEIVIPEAGEIDGDTSPMTITTQVLFHGHDDHGNAHQLRKITIMEPAIQSGGPLPAIRSAIAATATGGGGGPAPPLDWTPFAYMHYFPGGMGTPALTGIPDISGTSKPNIGFNTGCQLHAAGNASGHPDFATIRAADSFAGLNTNLTEFREAMGQFTWVCAMRRPNSAGSAIYLRTEGGSYCDLRILIGGADVQLQCSLQQRTFTGAMPNDTAGWHVVVAQFMDSNGRFAVDGTEFSPSATDVQASVRNGTYYVLGPNGASAPQVTLGEMIFLDADDPDYTWEHAQAAANELMAKWL